MRNLQLFETSETVEEPSGEVLTAYENPPNSKEIG